MACTSKYEAWSREWIEVLHKGREVVDGKPRLTYQQIADQLGTTRLRVEKAAQRYGCARKGRYGSARFSDSERQEIDRVLEHGVLVSLMCATDLQRLLASRGYKVSNVTVRSYVRALGHEVHNQYVKNVERKRRNVAHLATMRRLAKMASRNVSGETQVG